MYPFDVTMKPDPWPRIGRDCCGMSNWRKKSSIPGGTPCGDWARPREVLPVLGALKTSIDTTAGVTLFAIATNALLASAMGWTIADEGRVCANPSFVQLSPDATINPPTKAVTAATKSRALCVPIDMRLCG